MKALDQFDEYLVAAGRSTEVTDVTADDVREWVGWLNRNRAPATAAQRFASLQQFWKFVAAEDDVLDLDRSPIEQLSKPTIASVPVSVVSVDYQGVLLAVCDGKRFDDCRDAAIIRLLIDTGARLSEIADLQVGHVDLDERLIRCVVKGGHEQAEVLGPTGRGRGSVLMLVRSSTSTARGCTSGRVLVADRRPRTRRRSRWCRCCRLRSGRVPTASCPIGTRRVCCTMRRPG